ncbi:hypothetical protein ACOMHN_050525 [Nucella lapillus]
MIYDLHGQWDSVVGHHTALYSPTQDEKDSIRSVCRVLGLAFYGRSFNLTDSTNSEVGAPVTGPGKAGHLIGEQGFMAYYEVCKLMTEHNDTITSSGRLPGSQTPFVVDGNRWTGYDDVTSIKEKVDYAAANHDEGVSLFRWTMLKQIMMRVSLSSGPWSGGQTMPQSVQSPRTAAALGGRRAVVQDAKFHDMFIHIILEPRVDYAQQQGLGGLTIWAIDMDDFHGICGGGHYPLMQAIKQQMHESIVG